MRITIQIVIEAEPDQSPIIQEVAHLEREQLQPDTLGLHLAEARTVLHGIQQTLVEHQARAYLAQEARCSVCDQLRRHKGKHTIVLRTLFGTMHLASPRLFHCPCLQQPTQSFSPLAALLRERSTPELVYLETKFAALMSYGLTVGVLSELLPLGRSCARPHPSGRCPHGTGAGGGAIKLYRRVSGDLERTAATRFAADHRH